MIIGFLLYEVVAFRTARAASRRAPRLRRLALVWAAVALVAAAVVGFYLPTQVPGTMWEGFFRAILYVAAGAIVLVVLPVLLAAVIPRRRGGPTGGLPPRGHRTLVRWRQPSDRGRIRAS